MELAITFLAVVLINVLGTLKTVFLVQKQYKVLYLVLFIDSMLFVLVMGKVLGGDGIVWAVLYALGRVLGASIANIVDNRLALGKVLIGVFISNVSKARAIRDLLGKKGYSVNMVEVEGYMGIKRYKLEVMIARKEIESAYKILETQGYDRPTLAVQDLGHIAGKINVYSR